MEFQYGIIINGKVFKVGDHVKIIGEPCNECHGTFIGTIIKFNVNSNEPEYDEIEIQTDVETNGTYYSFFRISSQIEKIRKLK